MLLSELLQQADVGQFGVVKTGRMVLLWMYRLDYGISHADRVTAQQHLSFFGVGGMHSKR